jgi:hypothetical protein
MLRPAGAEGAEELSRRAIVVRGAVRGGADTATPRVELWSELIATARSSTQQIPWLSKNALRALIQAQHPVEPTWQSSTQLMPITLFGTEKMKAFRIFVLPALSAAPVFAFPYGILCALAVATFGDVGKPGVGVFGILASGAIFALILSVVPFTFYVIARLQWTHKEKIVREHLYGWPVGIAFLASVALALTMVVTGVRMSWVPVALLLSASMVGSGCLASRIWHSLAYR